ncbi:lipoyl(octanoyl) transferase LipB [Halorhodospira halochloris]|uniref:Octanoyltransferase n=1 Tax=Halorhodospira halochloris TaxID=1052 RepID=A0A110B4A8_HALHR|nr:lipoyl(octanoyl) transferase LipB [Halorhodospira halochloris]MBK1650989.1 octanoyltransferase [Halorhodospira halochloris]MCG5529356.1 lipoyl(octanoyl) transferase LipB [Halorhodospira halochloris]MCG5547331.1 lipoyl(octanoyl) transferase LipB [Halorhodospira halochloris]BAU56501.1 octanoate-[acyl-carrier-protein]-protein-N-octanoyltransferase [Halorhodospira halochloris]
MVTALLDTQVSYLGLRDYTDTWHEMRKLTTQRCPDSPDQVWIVQHPSVYTLGQSGKEEHILNPGDIPVIHSDRGGLVTWHGPGQIIAYPLLDLRRWGISVRELVHALEQAVISLLAIHEVASHRREGAPGVYVDGAKIAALGVRVKNGRCYHGVALNVSNDLEPFSRINPCGMKDMPTTRLYDHGVTPSLDRAEVELGIHLLAALEREAKH